MKYGNIKDMKVGDVVEYNHPGYVGSFTHGKLYISNRDYSPHRGSIDVTLDDRGSESNGHSEKFWKLVKTIPGKEAKVGDEVIAIGEGHDRGKPIKMGKVFTVGRISRGSVVGLENPGGQECVDADNVLVISKTITKFNPKILNEVIIISCKTREQAKTLLTWAHDNGKEWSSGDSFVNTNNWGNYKEDTCYNIYDGTFGTDSVTTQNIWSYEDALL